MRFVVDASTGAAVVDYLRAEGHDVVSVAEVMPQAADTAILAFAVAEQRIVVTNDKDFGELVYRSGQASAGIVLLRLSDESGANRVRVMASVLAQCADQLAGAFVVATESHIRVRRTP